ncbi:MAG: porin family protein [Chitinophagaceae bacterium]
MKFFLVAALLCFSMCTSAQIQWALKAGGQINDASYKRDGAKIATGSVAGFNAAVLARIYFDDKVAFVTGIQYSAKGFTVKTLPGDTQRTYRLNYVEIPILLQIDLSAKRGEGLYCKLGPTIGIGLHGKETHTGMNGMEVRNKAKLSLTGNYFGLFDASLNAALGYSFTQKFFAEAMYAYGVGNINNDQAGPNIKNRVLSLSVGYFLR